MSLKSCGLHVRGGWPDQVIRHRNATCKHWKSNYLFKRIQTNFQTYSSKSQNSICNKSETRQSVASLWTSVRGEDWRFLHKVLTARPKGEPDWTRQIWNCAIGAVQGCTHTVTSWSAVANVTSISGIRWLEMIRAFPCASVLFHFFSDRCFYGQKKRFFWRNFCAWQD